MSNNVAKLDVSYSGLIATLGLPDGTQILGIKDDRAFQVITLIVDHPGLGEVPDGGPIPNVELELTEVREGTARRVESRWLT